jgi:phage protein U
MQTIARRLAAAKQENQRLAGGFVGPIVAHVRLVGTMNPQAPGGRVPLSNAAAAVIELI